MTGWILAGLFAAAEIVLAFTAAKEQGKWMKCQLLFRVGETVLLTGILVMPFIYLKWRFACALGLLILRLLISGIVFLVKRKKASGEKSRAAAVVSCVLSVVLLTVSLTPAFLFANYNGLPNTGDLTVITSSAILVDSSRKETFETDGSFREVPVHFFYPQEDGEYPLIVFSHGSFGYYESNYSSFTELASHGYVVASMDHPYHSFFTEDTDGRLIIVDSQFISDAMRISNEDVDNEEAFAITSEWMKIRTGDANFVLDTIKEAKKAGSLGSAWHTQDTEAIVSLLQKTKTDKIGVFGHSMGGATMEAIGRTRSDVAAAVVLDGTFLGDITGVKDGKRQFEEEPYPVPLLDFSKETDYDEIARAKSETGYQYVNEEVMKRAKDGRLVLFRNTGHMDFTDLPLLSPAIASALGTGSVNSSEFLPMMNGIVLNWFDYYLKGEGVLQIQDKY